MALDATEKDLEQDRKIAALQGSVNTLNSGISALNTRVDCLARDMSAIANRQRTLTLGELIKRALGFR